MRLKQCTLGSALAPISSRAPSSVAEQWLWFLPKSSCRSVLVARLRRTSVSRDAVILWISLWPCVANHGVADAECSSAAAVCSFVSEADSLSGSCCCRFSQMKV